MSTITERLSTFVDEAAAAVDEATVAVAGAGSRPEDVLSAAFKIEAAAGALAAYAHLFAAAGWADGQADRITSVVVTEAIIDLLVRPVDDTWSGRQNDLARVRFEAKQEVCRRVFGLIESLRRTELLEVR